MIRTNGAGICPACEIRPRRVKSEICAACASHRHYWLAKIQREGPKAIGDYQFRLATWRHRMFYWGSQTETPRGFRNEVRKLKGA